MDNDEATTLALEPLSAPAQEPSSGQPLSSQTAFFRVPREGTPYFIAFAAKLSPGLAADGATSYVPAAVKGRTSDRLKRAVKDGDTIGVAFDGSQSIRFLGIDTPEKSYRAPFRPAGSNGGHPFIEIGPNAAEWDAYLIDAVKPGGSHTVVLREALRQQLVQRMAPGVAANHATLAMAASKALLDQLSKDIAELREGDVDAFGIFGAMSHEPFDGYGRVLAFLRPEQRDVPAPQRRLEYNTRQLADGMALPYFIWPNIDPFRKATLISEAVFAPSALRQRARSSPALNHARNAVRSARQALSTTRNSRLSLPRSSCASSPINVRRRAP